MLVVSRDTSTMVRNGRAMTWQDGVQGDVRQEGVRQEGVRYEAARQNAARYDGLRHGGPQHGVARHDLPGHEEAPPRSSCPRTLHRAAGASAKELPTTAATLAGQLVDALLDYGIDTYFGVPGGGIEPLFNALAAASQRGRARLITTRSEAAAAFAADGYYRATGKIAVCTSTTGPGATNLVTGVASAHADGVPMIVVTPQVPLAREGRGALQDSSRDGHDITSMLAGCTRYSSRVTHPAQLPAKLLRALSTLRLGRPGPVHLSVASELLAGPAAAMWQPQSAETFEAIDQRSVTHLLSALQSARRPVFVVGDEAGADAHRLLTIAERMHARIVCSPAGKRWLGHRGPIYLGVVGFAGHAEAQAAVDESDLLIALGTTFDELSTAQWQVFGQRRMFAVSRHTEFLHRMPATTPVLAPVGHLVRLLEELDPPSRPQRVRQPALGAESGSTRDSNGPTALGRRSGEHPVARPAAPGPVHPAALMKWLSRHVPEDVCIHVDAGSGFCWSTHYLDRSRPDTYRVAMGLSSMAWAISAAIGASVGGGKRTVCVCGDGSMLMSSLELTTAVQERLPVTYVVLNDSSLGMVRHGQVLNGAASIAHELPSIRFDQVARACGAQGIRVESAEDLSRIPAESFEPGGPWLIDVRIDPAAVPPMTQRALALQSGGSRGGA